MKELTDLINNYKPITKHEDDLVIDEFAKNIIDRVFNNLAIIFPAWKHNWKSDDASDPDKILRSAKREWTKAFVENNISTMDQISFGFTKARQADTDFLPSCGKFISWCKPSPEDLGYPTEQQAMRLCITHRNNQKMFTPQNLHIRPMIVELCTRIDWWLINTASSQADHKKASKHFNEEYLNLVNSDYQEPKETTHERLETKKVIIERMSPEQKEDGRKRHLDMLKDIKRKLKHKS